MEVRFLEGHLSLEGSSRKALRPGGEDLEIPSPTRQGLHNWGLNGPGWETHPRPPETPLRVFCSLMKELRVSVFLWAVYLFENSALNCPRGFTLGIFMTV